MSGVLQFRGECVSGVLYVLGASVCLVIYSGAECSRGECVCVWCSTVVLNVLGASVCLVFYSLVSSEGLCQTFPLIKSNFHKGRASE